MRTTYPRMLRFALPLAASLLLLLLLAACGGGEDGDDTRQSSAESTGGSGSSTDTDRSSGDKDSEEPSQVETEVSNFYEDIELSPDDLLKFLHNPSENLLYLDVSQAIEALRDHGDIRDQLKELWDDKDLTDEFGIKIQDVGYVVFGESGSPDVDVFLLGGLDLGDLRGSLEAADFLRDEISGLEVWLEDEDYHGGIAFIGDVILIAGSLPDALRRFDGSYVTTVDLMGRIAAGEATGEDVLQQLAGNEGVTGTILTHLAREFEDRYIGGTDEGDFFFQWMEADLFARYAGDEEASDAFDDWGSSRAPIHRDFTRWLVGDEDALEDFAHWVAGDEDTIREFVRQLADDEVRRYGSGQGMYGKDMWEGSLRGSGHGGYNEAGDLISGSPGGAIYAKFGHAAFGPELNIYISEYTGSNEVTGVTQEEWDKARGIFGRWVAGDEEAMAHVWTKLAKENQQLSAYELPEDIHRVRPYEDEWFYVALESGSAYDEVGAQWEALPPGILKQWAYGEPPYRYQSSFHSRSFGHSISQEGPQQFRLTGFMTFEDPEEAAERSTGLEPNAIHTACEATFETDGDTIKFDAICDPEALVELTDIG